MADLSGVTDNMLPVASEVFTNNLSAGISAGAATVPLNSTSGYSEDDVVVLTVDPNTADQATFTGKVQGNSIINCEWTEGNVGASHSLGATVTDFDSATHYNMVTKVLRQTHSQEGKLLTSAVQEALNISDAVPADWTPLANTPTVTANNGQKEHVLTYTAVNYTDRLQAGTKLRIPRTGTTPTQSMAFVAASSQYASKSTPAGITFTDDFTCEAWVYIENYSSSVQQIVGRRVDAGASGWALRIEPNGQALIIGANGVNLKAWTSVQSIPTGKWVHIAASADLSATSGAIYFDGVSVATTLQNTGSPTALVQTGDLRVGASNSPGNFMDGKLANIRVWSAIRTAAQIRDNMNQESPASTTGLVAHFKGNGSWDDSSANLNHLTAAGGALNNSVSHPYSAVEYAIATKVLLSGADTLVTVFTGNGCIPQEALGSTSYSAVRAPFGFPVSSNEWKVSHLCQSYTAQSSPVVGTWYNLASAKLQVPVGDWSVSASVRLMLQHGGAGFLNATGGLSDTGASSAPIALLSDTMDFSSPSQTENQGTLKIQGAYSQISASPLYFNAKANNAGTTLLASKADAGSMMVIEAECAYL